MRKRFLLAVGLLGVVLAAGCGGGGTASKTVSQSPGVNEVLEAGMKKADGGVDNAAAGESSGSADAAAEKSGASENSGADEAVAGTPETPAGETGTVAAESAAAASSGRQSGVDENAPEPETSVKTVSSAEDTAGIDVDLTKMSSTMVYSEVYNMLVNPDDYIGKTVRMRGNYASSQNPVATQMYFACIIQDATACCSQGIEFVPQDHYKYPDQYPAEGQEITVTGVFDTYKEGEYMYCTLRNAEWT